MSGKRGTYFEIEQLERRVEKLELILEKFMEQWGPDVQKRRDERDRRWDEMIRVLTCLLYTSPSPRDATLSRMPSSA